VQLLDHSCDLAGSALPKHGAPRELLLSPGRELVTDWSGRMNAAHLRSSSAARRALAIVLLGCSACSSGSEDGAPDSGGPSSATGSIGSFSIELHAPEGNVPGHTSLLGVVYRGPYPSPVAWRAAREVGACRLLVPQNPFCDPACPSGSVCVEDGRCVPRPEVASVGVVTMRGLRTSSGDTEFSMTQEAGNYQPGVDVGTLPYPAFAAGDLLELETSGGDLAPFSLSTPGIAALELTTPTPIRVARGEPVLLEWTPSPVPGAGSIRVQLDVSHHGGAKSLIECNTEDTGSISIAEALVTDMLDLGVAGFPSAVLSRLSLGSTHTEAGTVELAAFSLAEAPIEIPGLTSCSSDEQCEPGTTCTDARTCE